MAKTGTIAEIANILTDTLKIAREWARTVRFRLSRGHKYRGFLYTSQFIVYERAECCHCGRVVDVHVYDTANGKRYCIPCVQKALMNVISTLAKELEARCGVRGS